MSSTQKRAFDIDKQSISLRRSVAKLLNPKYTEPINNNRSLWISCLRKHLLVKIKLYVMPHLPHRSGKARIKTGNDILPYANRSIANVILPYIKEML